MHESWNIGLDPSLDIFRSRETHAESQKDGELSHSSNLWPDKAIWDQAEAFKKANLEY
jgi:hypothetical protein